MPHNNRKNALRTAAAVLATATMSLAVIEVTINETLASYEAGPEWAPHPLVADVLVRAWPTPPGATYKVLEFQAKAGTQVPLMSRPTASLLHVLRGSILVRRHDDKGRIEVCEAGQMLHFAAGERHGSLVLKDSHTLIVFSA